MSSSSSRVLQTACHSNAGVWGKERRDSICLLIYFLVTFHLRCLLMEQIIAFWKGNLSNDLGICKPPFTGLQRNLFHYRAWYRILTILFCRKWRIFSAACWIFIRLKSLYPLQTFPLQSFNVWKPPKIVSVLLLKFLNRESWRIVHVAWINQSSTRLLPTILPNGPNKTTKQLKDSNQLYWKRSQRFVQNGLYFCE